MRPVSAIEDSSTAGRRKPLVYVHIFYGKDVDAYRQGYIDGKEPDQSPYGFHLAKEEGFDVSFSHDAPPLTGLARKVANRLPINLHHAFSNRHRIRAADAVWTMTEGEAFAVASLIALRIVPRRPVVGNAVWLLDRWREYGGIRRLFYRALSRYLSVMTVHSVECLPIIRSVMPSLCSRLLYFGVNTGVFKLASPAIKVYGSPIKLFATGNDRTRDWLTFFAAFGNDPRFHLTVICWWISDAEVAQYNNVSIVRSPAMVDFLRCYAETDIVVVPMNKNVFSGITVALEAVALGKPVLASRTGGLPTYFGEECFLYVNPGDPSEMRKAVLEDTSERAHKRAQCAQAVFLERDYSTKGMIRRYADITRHILVRKLKTTHSDAC